MSYNPQNQYPAPVGTPQELPAQYGAPPNPAHPPYPSGTPQPGQYPPQQPGQYPPQQPGQYPPQQPGQYPPQQPGQYPPPQPGQYPPQQPGQYPPQQPGQYPPQQPGQYPPQQPGQYPPGAPPNPANPPYPSSATPQPGQYPPPQPGQYPPQQPGQYPPQQPGQYPPQQPGQYPPQQPGQYPPQQPGQYPPQQPGQYPPPQQDPRQFQQQPGQYPPQQPGQFPPQQPGQYLPQQPGYPAHGPYPGYPPQQQPFGQPQGYAPPQTAVVASATYKQDIVDLNKAAKGFGCDEKAVIKILGTRNAPTIDAIRNNFRKETKKDLVGLLEKELGGHLETVCMATALGREESEAFWARRALKGVGTDEVLLTEALCGKKNAEIEIIKKAYRAKYFAPLEEDLKGDLSGKTEKLFLMAIEGQRQEDWIQPDHNMVQRDVDLLHMATEARVGTDEIQVFTIFTRSNEAHLRAVAHAYQQAHRKPLSNVIKSEFSGHQEDALLYILDGAIDKPRRDAELLEEAMKGFGTKDVLLMSRIVRIHWDQYHLEAVKKAYYNMYHRDLIVRVKGETSGNYEKMLVTLLGGN